MEEFASSSITSDVKEFLSTQVLFIRSSFSVFIEQVVVYRCSSHYNPLYTEVQFKLHIQIEMPLRLSFLGKKTT